VSSLPTDDNYADDAETGAVGGRALPLDVDRASRITSVKVENLAMVDSVSIEVKTCVLARLRLCYRTVCGGAFILPSVIHLFMPST